MLFAFFCNQELDIPCTISKINPQFQELCFHSIANRHMKKQMSLYYPVKHPLKSLSTFICLYSLNFTAEACYQGYAQNDVLIVTGQFSRIPSSVRKVIECFWPPFALRNLLIVQDRKKYKKHTKSSFQFSFNFFLWIE